MHCIRIAKVLHYTYMAKVGKKHAPNPRRAVLYTRVSTEEQAAQGVSLEAQQATLRSYCSMKRIEVEALVTDAGVSAGKPLCERPGGAAVLSLVVKKAVTEVVTLKLDRLFRDAVDALSVTRTWDKQNVALHLVDMGGQAIDTSTPMGRFFLTMMAGFAELERNTTVERTRSALAHKRDQGQRVGQVPYGFRVEDDGVHLAPEPTEQAIIEHIGELRADGLSHRAIAGRLNEEDVPARGKRWHPTTVARLLRRQVA